jgi:hypothetical protein
LYKFFAAANGDKCLIDGGTADLFNAPDAKRLVVNFTDASPHRSLFHFQL